VNPQPVNRTIDASSVDAIFFLAGSLWDASTDYYRDESANPMRAAQMNEIDNGSSRRMENEQCRRRCGNIPDRDIK
jgi:hypothetical protein